MSIVECKLLNDLLFVVQNEEIIDCIIAVLILVMNLLSDALFWYTVLYNWGRLSLVP